MAGGRNRCGKVSRRENKSERAKMSTVVAVDRKREVASDELPFCATSRCITLSPRTLSAGRRRVVRAFLAALSTRALIASAFARVTDGKDTPISAFPAIRATAHFAFDRCATNSRSSSSSICILDKSNFLGTRLTWGQKRAAVAGRFSLPQERCR